MVRKTEYGTFIISAGEVGAYTVCPEAWRLKTVERVEVIKTESIHRGRELHRQWAADYEEAEYLSYTVRLILGVLFIVVLTYLLI